MKVKDLIAALTNCPMDDDVAVRLELAEEYQDVAIASAKRVNDSDRPHSVLFTDGDFAFKVSFVAD